LSYEMISDNLEVLEDVLLDDRDEHAQLLEQEVAQPLLRKVDVRPPGKGNLNSHGARPVHLSRAAPVQSTSNPHVDSTEIQSLRRQYVVGKVQQMSTLHVNFSWRDVNFSWRLFMAGRLL